MGNIESSENGPSRKYVPDKGYTLPSIDITDAEENSQIMEAAKTPASAEFTAKDLVLDKRKSKEKKLGHRRVDEEGQITFKKIQTSQIMGSIQLGIEYAVGSLASKPERDLLMLDFTIVETTFFPRSGSNITPAHHYSDFKFKSYAPLAFRYFRDLFGIPPDDYLLALCNSPLQELTNPGASGSIFYLNDDGEFIIKTVQHREAEFLQKLLPGYYMNLNENPRTLLPKYYGLYCYICGGKNIRFSVMNNLLPPTLKIHEKYDLKGSTFKRKASKHERKKASPTFKDLDFMERYPDGIYLEPDTYNALIKTISRDCRVLESFKIMDYSLLVGIHNVDLSKEEKLKLKEKEGEEYEPENGIIPDNTTSEPSSEKNKPSLMRSKSMNKQRLAAFSTAMESIEVEIEIAEDDEDLQPGGIPAKNAKGERLLLFLGIIDILQSFRFKKKLEHAWKSVLHDGDTVSVHRPAFYAQRFQDFMSKTVFKKTPARRHSPLKRKSVSSKPQPLPLSEIEASTNCPSKISPESECTQEEGSFTQAPPSSHSHFPDIESPLVANGSGSNVSSWSSQNTAKPHANTDPPSRMVSFEDGANGENSSVTWDQTSISSSQAAAQTECIADYVSETSSSGTSGLGSTLHTVRWTIPHSIERSSSTRTEGTLSFTESSASDDAVCSADPDENKSLESLPPIGETYELGNGEMTHL